MDERAPSRTAESGPLWGPAPEVLAGLGAFARVSRALVAAHGLEELARRALSEMRDALHLSLAALYVPAPDGGPQLERFVVAAADDATVRARDGLRYEQEAWRLAVASGMPIVFREPAGWLGTNPFEPPAANWLVLPLVAGGQDMVGVVAAAAERPVALDPVSATVLALLGAQLSVGITTARLRQRLREAEVEHERRTLAADVHDGLAQDLAVALRELALLDEPGLDDATARASRDRLREAVAEAHRVVRSRLEDLRAPAPRGGLRAALAATAERFERRGLRLRVSVEGTTSAVAPDTVEVVRRVAGEALANVSRHARASGVTLAVRVDDRRLELLVDDDGVGFDPAAAAGRADGHFGLAIMRERAEACGGECEVRPRPGGGTRVLLRVPVAAGAIDAATQAGSD